MLTNEATSIALEVPKPEPVVAAPVLQPVQPFDGIQASYGVARLRLLAASIRRTKGGFTSAQVRAFLLLYGDDLQAALDQTVRDFLTEKVGE
jgi:hypothetical protein